MPKRRKTICRTQADVVTGRNRGHLPETLQGDVAASHVSDNSDDLAAIFDVIFEQLHCQVLPSNKRKSAGPQHATQYEDNDPPTAPAPKRK